MREESNDIETRAAVLTDAADLINSALKLFEGLEDAALDDLTGILEEARNEAAFQLKLIRSRFSDAPDDDALLEMKHENDRYGYKMDCEYHNIYTNYLYTTDGRRIASEVEL